MSRSGIICIPTMLPRRFGFAPCAAEAGRYTTALKTLSECLKQHHRKNVIILLDEYDVPLENAWENGFYDEMVGVDEETNKPITEKKSLGFFKQPKLNPEYDPSKEYVNRSDRQEWDAVGMLGKLYVRDNGTCEVNGYATVGEDGVATASSEKTNMRVLSRVNKNVVRVLLK